MALVPRILEARGLDVAPPMIVKLEKFVDLDIYNAMQKEIRHEGGFGSMSKHTANYEENSKKLVSNRQQLEEGVKERDELKQKLESSLSNWCGQCKSGFGNCDARLTFLQESKIDTVQMDTKDVLI